MSGSQNNRRRDPGGLDGQTILLMVALGFLVAVSIPVDGAMKLGHMIVGDGEKVPGNPLAVLAGLLKGRLSWPGVPGWIVFAVIVAVMLAVVLAVVVMVDRRHQKRSRVDGAAAFMGRGRDVEDLSSRVVEAKSKRLGVQSALPGVPIGVTVMGNRPLFGSWEDMHVDIWGPRTGKTTSRAVPAILDAPGPVLATSNKRDLVDATRDVRSARGYVWVFDPQQIARESPAWWWNPLSYVTDEVKAAKMAEHFASGSREAGARTDAYFDPAGQDLLAGLLLAAALDGRPITDVYTWLTRPADVEPADILRREGYPLSADQVEGIIMAPDKQRGGVYGTAQQMASCLTVRSIAAWVTPQGPADTRPQFDAQSFVRMPADTLYSLSKEGRGTAGPLVTALTAAVVEAAEEMAAVSSGGRLSTPLLCVLDEAANVCRWRDLPALYSHYGSRGIVIMTILQSWAQGEEVWGEKGMKKLWSSANVRVYGGGVDDHDFLSSLSATIGDRDRLMSSTSRDGRGNRNVSEQLHRERILEVADLAALPRGRAVVMGSGSRPTLVRTVPWMRGPHAEEVEASIRAHDPQGSAHLEEARKELAENERELAEGKVA